ncbi:hypothetical protein G5C51_02755 [Streptomyces sp. A7024]|uniref:Uncharacterized protein n=1 Tax=Streptomyces coryli TaxID=1128680 RepID=A0A6G4TSP4_9ACTN|nr:hypothetical protein [Streptomyces coryli]NGN62823.1 hypothetical protein [Streptomyces coryli]
MELPAYWMSRPEPRPDRRTSESFDLLLEQALADGPDVPIDYRLEAPKWQFLCHAADRGTLVLHGSGDPAIKRFEPRQPDDTSEFGNRCAVFAAGDGLWPMYYAVLDRERHPMSLINGCARVADGSSGQLGDPHYYFSISARALKQQPWRAGTVYLLPADTFELQPRIQVGDASIQLPQWASPLPVTPVAKLDVHPEDFPFLDHIRGHDDDQVRTRAAANPDGFPWHDEA